MNFGGFLPMWLKGICRNQLIYATDHLYGICQQEVLKILAWRVASDRGKGRYWQELQVSFSSIYLQRKRRNSQICLIFQV